MDVKYRASRFLLELQYKSLKKPVLSFTHGGFISSLLFSKGRSKMPSPGSVVIVEYRNFFDYESEQNKIFLSFFNEFSKALNCSDESYNENFYKKYCHVFEEYLKDNIEKVEYIYEIPDLSEEIF